MPSDSSYRRCYSLNRRASALFVDFSDITHIVSYCIIHMHHIASYASYRIIHMHHIASYASYRIIHMHHIASYASYRIIHTYASHHSRHALSTNIWISLDPLSLIFLISVDYPIVLLFLVPNHPRVIVAGSYTFMRSFEDETYCKVGRM